MKDSGLRCVLEYQPSSFCNASTEVMGAWAAAIVTLFSPAAILPRWQSAVTLG